MSRKRKVGLLIAGWIITLLVVYWGFICCVANRSAYFNAMPESPGTSSFYEEHRDEIIRNFIIEYFKKMGIHEPLIFPLFYLGLFAFPFGILAFFVMLALTIAAVNEASSGKTHKSEDPKQ